MGFKMSDIKAILVNHNHGDQSGGAAYMKEKTGAPLMAGFGEIPYVEHGMFNPPAIPAPPAPDGRGRGQGRSAGRGRGEGSAHRCAAPRRIPCRERSRTRRVPRQELLAHPGAVDLQR